MSANKYRAGELYQVTGLPKRMKMGKQSSDLIDNETLLGIEVEVEGFSLNDTLYRYGWTDKDDGSLRNGIEFTFNGPMSGEAAVDAMRAICNPAILVHNSSPRAGTHIHVDWLDVEEVESVYRVAVIAAVIEPAIYECVSRERAYNTFVQPHMKTGLRDLCRVLSRGDTAGMVDYLHNTSRYRGTNLNALARFGSVEFRYFPAISTYQELLSWANLCLMMKRAAVVATAGMSAGEVASMLADKDRLVAFINDNFEETGWGLRLSSSIDVGVAVRAARMLAIASKGENVVRSFQYAGSASACAFIDKATGRPAAPTRAVTESSSQFSDMEQLIAALDSTEVSISQSVLQERMARLGREMFNGSES